MSQIFLGVLGFKPGLNIEFIVGIIGFVYFTQSSWMYLRKAKNASLGINFAITALGEFCTYFRLVRNGRYLYISQRISVGISLTCSSFQVIQPQSERPGVPPWPGLLLHLHQLHLRPTQEGGRLLLHPQHEGHLQGGGAGRAQARPRHQHGQGEERAELPVQRLRQTHPGREAVPQWAGPAGQGEAEQVQSL